MVIVGQPEVEIPVDLSRREEDSVYWARREEDSVYWVMVEEEPMMWIPEGYRQLQTCLMEGAHTTEVDH